MRRLVVSCLVLFAVVLGACDSVTPEERQEEFEASVPPLQISVEVLSASPVRDTLRVRVTSDNSETGIASVQGTLGEERVVASPPQDGVLEYVASVSELDGTLAFAVEVRDTFIEVVDGDTLYADRLATASLQVEIEQTLWRRGVSSPSPYESDVSAVYSGVSGELWVHLSEFPSSFWSSADGVSFVKRSTGFDRYLDSDGEVAWVEHRTAAGGGQTYLHRVDLATGETGKAYRVFYDDGLQAGAGFGEAFYGIHQSRQHLMRIEGERVAFIESGPYEYDSVPPSLLGYHISPDGVHWLATADRGVLRNDGTGWQSTSGLGSDAASLVGGTPDGQVFALAAPTGGLCAVATWTGSGWAEQASFPPSSSGCGTVALSTPGRMWVGAPDGHIVRYVGGVADRRYRGAASDLLVQGSTVWAATNDGLIEIDDYDSP